MSESDTPRTDAIFSTGQQDLRVVELAILCHQLERELLVANKLKNIYHGAITSAFQCETHFDVTAEHCPICLLNERDELREQLAAANKKLVEARNEALDEALEISISVYREYKEREAAHYRHSPTVFNTHDFGINMAVIGYSHEMSLRIRSLKSTSEDV